MGHRHLFVLSLGLLALLLTIAATAHDAGGHARGAGAITAQQKGGMDDDGVESMVGSRPPSCAGMCWWCGGRRCEAVQVPITQHPEQDKSRRHGHGHGSGEGGSSKSTREGGRGPSSSSSAHQQQRRRPSTSSYDDHSNYKPLSWRCKCRG